MDGSTASGEPSQCLESIRGKAGQCVLWRPSTRGSSLSGAGLEEDGSVEAREWLWTASPWKDTEATGWKLHLGTRKAATPSSPKTAGARESSSRLERAVGCVGSPRPASLPCQKGVERSTWEESGLVAGEGQLQRAQLHRFGRSRARSKAQR